MYPITEMLLTPNTYSRPQRKISIRGIVIHWTANEGKGADADANRNFFENRKAGKTGFGSAHYIVDSKQIVKCVPDNEMCYHVGSTTYTKEAIAKYSTYPNATTIGIEICVNSDGNFMTALQQTIELAAYLCKRYGLNPATDITTHKAIVGWKDCPSFYVTPSYSQKYFGTTDYAGQWKKFLNSVAVVMNPPKPPKEEELVKVFKDIANHWAKKDIEALESYGIVKGDGKGSFHPDEPVTKAEMAAMLNRAIKYVQTK